LEWSKLAVVATRAENGEVTLAFPTDVKPVVLPPNTILDLSGFGMRAAYMQRTDEPLDIKVKRASDAPEVHEP